MSLGCYGGLSADGSRSFRFHIVKTMSGWPQQSIIFLIGRPSGLPFLSTGTSVSVSTTSGCSYAPAEPDPDHLRTERRGW
jgi:hypothetical protein